MRQYFKSHEISSNNRKRRYKNKNLHNWGDCQRLDEIFARASVARVSKSCVLDSRVTNTMAAETVTVCSVNENDTPSEWSNRTT